MKKPLAMFSFLLGLVLALGDCKQEPDATEGFLDLDTTYFPFGADYEWVYEEKVKTFREGQLISEDTQTYHVQVLDSSGTDSTCTFELEGYFDDLPSTAEIEAGSVYVFLEGYRAKPGKTVNVVKPETDTLTDLYHDFSVEYAAETLEIKLTYITDKEGEVGARSVSRVKGTGMVYQRFSFTSPPDSQYVLDKTLFFRKGQDTIWP